MRKSNQSQISIYGESLISYFRTFGIDFRKVKGHTLGTSVHECWNNYVDRLAQQTAQEAS